MNWKEVEEKITIMLQETREAARKHNDQKAKLLCKAYEATLEGVKTGSFTFDANYVKSFHSSYNPVMESHPEVKEKIEILYFWTMYFINRMKNPNVTVREALNTMEILISVYRVRRQSFRTSIIVSILDEATKQVYFHVTGRILEDIKSLATEVLELGDSHITIYDSDEYFENEQKIADMA